MFLCAVAATLAVSFEAGAEPALETWVPAGRNDIRKDDWRRESPGGYIRSVLDMDGDGRPDEAVLVTSRDGSRSGVRICLDFQRVNPTARCEVVGVGPNVQSIMGVHRRPPGCYSFVQKEGAGNGDGEVCSETDVLDYFRFGSAGSFFRYDRTAKGFDRYWDSD